MVETVQDKELMESGTEKENQSQGINQQEEDDDLMERMEKAYKIQDIQQTKKTKPALVKEEKKMESVIITQTKTLRPKMLKPEEVKKRLEEAMQKAMLSSMEKNVEFDNPPPSALKERQRLLFKKHINNQIDDLKLKYDETKLATKLEKEARKQIIGVAPDKDQRALVFLVGYLFRPEADEEDKNELIQQVAHQQNYLMPIPADPDEFFRWRKLVQITLMAPGLVKNMFLILDEIKLSLKWNCVFINPGEENLHFKCKDGCLGWPHLNPYIINKCLEIYEISDLHELQEQDWPLYSQKCFFSAVKLIMEFYSVETREKIDKLA